MQSFLYFFSVQRQQKYLSNLPNVVGNDILHENETTICCDQNIASMYRTAENHTTFTQNGHLW